MRTLSVLLVVAIMGMAATAGAYDGLYTRDGAMTHDAGAFGIEVGFGYVMANASYDQDGEKQDWGDDDKYTMISIPVELYYSVMDNLELAVKPEFLMLKDEYETMEVREMVEMEGTGLGDTWFWAKYMFMPEPMVTARVGAKIATGDSEPDEGDLATGSGQMDIDGALMLGMPAGPGMFDVSAGYRMRMEDEDKFKPGDEIHFAAVYTYFLGEMMNLRIGADGFFGSDPEFDGEPIEVMGETWEGSNAVWINPGFDYMMDNGMTIGLDVHYPLMGKNIHALWGGGIYVGWGG